MPQKWSKVPDTKTLLENPVNNKQLRKNPLHDLRVTSSNMVPLSPMLIHALGEIAQVCWGEEPDDSTPHEGEELGRCG